MYCRLFVCNTLVTWHNTFLLRSVTYPLYPVLMKRILLCAWLLLVVTSTQAQTHHFEVSGRFESTDARQGVAVDSQYVYVVSNYSISKHDKKTGEELLRWEGEEGNPLIHLNSGIVIDGILYCAHSNYPDIPMASSIEMFDPETLAHIGSHSLGIMHGSATWIDRRDGVWWIGFAHYDGRGGVQGRGPAWTRIVLFDNEWRAVGGYIYPQDVVERFLDRSNSGAAFGPDGRLYATGHDAAEVYALRIPSGGSILELEEVIPVEAEGQGIAWDPFDPGTLYTMIKKDRMVVRSVLKRN